MRNWIISALAILCSFAAAKIKDNDVPAHRHIHKDVVILGGGASGVYSAVRMREDLHLSVIIIEAKDRLGGHTETWTDPVSHTPINIGVQTYIEYGPAKHFFKRFDIPIAHATLKPTNVVFADIATGHQLSHYHPASNEALFGALKRYVSAAKKYQHAILPGLWNFYAPEHIPEELLLPWGEFAKRYDLEALSALMAQTSNFGVGGLKKVKTLYAMFALGVPIAECIINNKFFVPAKHVNTILYERAYHLLKHDVLLNSQVLEAQRGKHGVRIVVKASDGHPLVIHAKKLLVTAPPSIKNLAVFGLDKQETEVFSTWTPTWSFTGIIRSHAVPENTSITWMSSDAVPDKHLNIRNYPYTMSCDSVGPPGSHLFHVLFSTDYKVTNRQAADMIRRQIKQYSEANGAKANHEVKLEYLTDHNSVLWRQSEKLLKEGFVQKLNALQGRHSTWYTGGLWSSDYSSNVWAFTETLLPKMLHGLMGLTDSH